MPDSTSGTKCTCKNVPAITWLLNSRRHCLPYQLPVTGFCEEWSGNSQRVRQSANLYTYYVNIWFLGVQLSLWVSGRPASLLATAPGVRISAGALYVLCTLLLSLIVPPPKVRQRELAKADANRRALGMLNLLHDKNEGTDVRIRDGRKDDTTTCGHGYWYFVLKAADGKSSYLSIYITSWASK